MRVRTGLVPRRSVAVLAVAVAALAGCSSKHPPQAAPAPTTTTPAPTTSAAPKPPPKPGRVPLTGNPLTGKPTVPHGPVFAVKIDNTAAGRPQIGLESADVVYVEQVEGGASRLVAVFASRYPGRVGPVRSVRNTDPELLSAYGPAGLVFSGGAGGPLKTLHRSTLRDLAGSGVYSRDHSRPAPYNLIADLHRLAARPSDLARVRDVGFRWSDRPPAAGARKAARFTVPVGRVDITFGYDARAHRWVQAIGGSQAHTASGAPVATPNVIVEFCRVSTDPTDVDVLGSPSKFTHTVGSGRAVVFRDGRAVSGRWARSKAGRPTRYVDAAGADIPLRTGGTWVLLVASGSRLQVR